MSTVSNWRPPAGCFGDRDFDYLDTQRAGGSVAGSPATARILPPVQPLQVAEFLSDLCVDDELADALVPAVFNLDDGEGRKLDAEPAQKSRERGSLSAIRAVLHANRDA